MKTSMTNEEKQELFNSLEIEGELFDDRFNNYK